MAVAHFGVEVILIVRFSFERSKSAWHRRGSNPRFGPTLDGEGDDLLGDWLLIGLPPFSLLATACAAIEGEPVPPVPVTLRSLNASGSIDAASRSMQSPAIMRQGQG